MTKEENRIIISKQTREIIKGNKDRINEHRLAIEVTCNCGIKKNILYMYKCFYCGIFFCKKCGQEHFRKRTLEEKTKIINKIKDEKIRELEEMIEFDRG